MENNMYSFSVEYMEHKSDPFGQLYQHHTATAIDITRGNHKCMARFITPLRINMIA